MTTTVTVTTHDCSASVFAFPLDERGESVEGESYEAIGSVPPHSSIEFSVWSGRDVLIREDIPADAIELVAAAELMRGEAA
jgi:hypothetical protein